MAEIRKHNPASGQSAIARALEQAMGAAVRPVAPGARPQPGADENADIEPPARPGIDATSSAPAFTVGTGTAGTPSWMVTTRPRTPDTTPRRDTDGSAPGADD